MLAQTLTIKQAEKAVIFGSGAKTDIKHPLDVRWTSS